MFREVYYENGNINRDGDGPKEPMVIPYGVYEKDRAKREEFYNFLKAEGFRCVSWNYSYPLVLVNMELHRFALIQLPTYYTMVDARRYTMEEFLEEVYYPSQDAKVAPQAR